MSSWRATPSSCREWTAVRPSYGGSPRRSPPCHRSAPPRCRSLTTAIPPSSRASPAAERARPGRGRRAGPPGPAPSRPEPGGDVGHDRGGEQEALVPHRRPRLVGALVDPDDRAHVLPADPDGSTAHAAERVVLVLEGRPGGGDDVVVRPVHVVAGGVEVAREPRQVHLLDAAY